MSIGTNINRLRVRQGLSQDALAGLTVWTCRVFRELRPKNSRRFWVLLALGAVLWLGMPLGEDLALRSVMEQGAKGGMRAVNLLMILAQYAGLALFELLAVYAAALIRRRRED